VTAVNLPIGTSIDAPSAYTCHDWETPFKVTQICVTFEGSRPLSEETMHTPHS